MRSVVLAEGTYYTPCTPCTPASSVVLHVHPCPENYEWELANSSCHRVLKGPFAGPPPHQSFPFSSSSSQRAFIISEQRFSCQFLCIPDSFVSVHNKTTLFQNEGLFHHPRCCWPRCRSEPRRCRSLHRTYNPTHQTLLFLPILIPNGLTIIS